MGARHGGHQYCQNNMAIHDAFASQFCGFANRAVPEPPRIMISLRSPMSDPVWFPIPECAYRQ